MRKDINELKAALDAISYCSIVRTLDALNCNRNASLIQSHLNKNQLAKLAKEVNSSFLHISANCSLLSRALLFNLKAGKSAISVNNIYPIFEPANSVVTEKLIFNGQMLTEAASHICSVKDLELEIINLYKKHGEKFYVVSGTHKTILGLEVGHDFNAVVIEKDNKPLVQFVDAWKTSNLVPTLLDLEKRYPQPCFEIRMHIGPVNLPILENKLTQKNLKPELKKTDLNFTVETFKACYLKQYRSEFFKRNSKNSMIKRIHTIKSLDEILEHAEKFPRSRTSKVIRNLRAGL